MPPSKATGIDKLHHRGDEPHLLREILRTHQVLMAGFTRGVGMSASRFLLMRLLATAEEEVGVMDLARLLGINAAAVTRQVKELEGERLVRRRPDPRDGRRSYVRLSPKGLRLFEEIHARSHELERSLSSLIDAEEMAITTRVLMKLRIHIEGLRRVEKGGAPW
jgi:DNA-binding MarR family transcriptional regulator